MKVQRRDRETGEYKEIDYSVWGLLTLGLSREAIIGVITVSWRAAIVFHIAWACGWLAQVGLGNGFAKADTVNSYRSEQELITKLSLVRELREQIETYCYTQDPRVKSVLIRTIDQLREDYFKLTGKEYPEVRCSNG